MWKQKNREASYDYTNSKGEVVANVRLVGIQCRWRWSCSTFATQRTSKGWFGTKHSREEAQQAAEEFLSQREAL